MPHKATKLTVGSETRQSMREVTLDWVSEPFLEMLERVKGDRLACSLLDDRSDGDNRTMGTED
jgi:hypothetical protein